MDSHDAIPSYKADVRARGSMLQFGLRGIEHGYPPNIRDTLCLLKRAWDDIPQESIVNCWIKSRSLPDNIVEDLKETSKKWRDRRSGEDMQDLTELLGNMEISAYTKKILQGDN